MTDGTSLQLALIHLPALAETVCTCRIVCMHTPIACAGTGLTRPSVKEAVFPSFDPPLITEGGELFSGPVGCLP